MYVYIVSIRIDGGVRPVISAALLFMRHVGVSGHVFTQTHIQWAGCAKQKVTDESELTG